jgi:hypothetical protein
MEFVFTYSHVWSLTTIQRTSAKFDDEWFNTESFQAFFILVHKGKNQYFERSAGTRMYSPEQIKMYNS